MNNKRVTRNAIFGIIQLISSVFILFFLYGFLLKEVGAEKLGLWSLILAGVSVSRLSELGFSGSVLRFVAKHLSNDKERNASNIIQTAFLSVGFLLALLAIIVYPALSNLLSWVVPQNMFVLADTILPWSIASLWVAMLSGIFQSALDGCQRMDIRNILLVICNVVYFLCAIFLVPEYGLKGIAIAQFLQSVLLLVLSWTMLKRQLIVLPLVPYQWSKHSFSEMFSYAMNFQVISISGLLFEPVTKFLLSHYAGLASTAYYEMANQVIIKARAILVSGFQAILPEIASIKDSDKEDLKKIYQKSYRISLFIALPYFLSICLALPLISILWIGYLEFNFVVFGEILAIGWLLNTMSLPAYFFNLGAGNISWNMRLHVLMSTLNLLIGWLLGVVYGGYGVVIASMISLLMGNWILVYIIQKDLDIGANEIIPKKYRIMLFWMLFGFAASIMVHILANSYNQSILMTSLISLLIYMCVIFFAMWFDPLVRPFKRKLFCKICNLDKV